MGFESCGPDEAIIVSGCGLSRPLMIAGGRVWVWPCQQIQRMSLKTLTLKIVSENVNTKNGIPISCIGVAQVKIQGQSQELLATACSLFLGKDEDEVKKVAMEILENHQSAVIGNMTAIEVYQNRKKFATQFFDLSSSDLINMGIGVVSYSLKDVTDSQHYFQALGKARAAQAREEARIEEEKGRDEMKKTENDAIMEQSKNDYLPPKAHEEEIDRGIAEVDQAYNLQEAITKELEKGAQMQVREREPDACD